MANMRYIAIVIVALLAWSCQDVIEIDTDESTKSLTVYGQINDTTGARVSLSLTTSYFEQGTNPPINDAEVYLFEHGVVVGELSRTATDGEYFLNYPGILNKSYHIEILLPASYGLPQNWATSNEVLSRVFQPDSFSWRFLDRTTVPAVFEEGYYSILYFKEPDGVGDNYRIRRWLNDSLFTQEFFIFEDQNFDGADFGGVFPGFGIYGPMEEGDTMSIEISSISREYFEFLTLVNEQVFQVGGPFDPPPSPIVGNVYNVDQPSEYGYGFFSASAQTHTMTIIDP